MCLFELSFNGPNNVKNINVDNLRKLQYKVSAPFLSHNGPFGKRDTFAYL